MRTSNSSAELERENERLRDGKQVLIKDREDRDALVEYVEEEISYREAGLATRAKWWLFGKE